VPQKGWVTVKHNEFTKQSKTVTLSWHPNLNVNKKIGWLIGEHVDEQMG
jgi:hypothetical protein